MSSLPINDLKRPAEYRAPRAHIFPSDGSLSWHMRMHRAELIEAGAMRKIGGQWFIHAPRFDAVLLDEPQGQ